VLLPTSLVGSYSQPDWLIDKDRIYENGPPRTRAEYLWRIDSQFLEGAQDDATLLAIRDQEKAGLDIITDGEARRESYSNRFATALDGVDLDRPGTTMGRGGQPVVVPRVVGKIRRKHPVQVRDVEFLRANTDRPIKITVPGPFTLAQQAQNDFYASDEAMAFDYAIAVNEELRDLVRAGADIVQLDEPWLQARPEIARRYGVAVIDRALEGIDARKAVHLCFGYGIRTKSKPDAYEFLAELNASQVDEVSVETAQSKLDCSTLTGLPDKAIILGVLDLSTDAVETPGVVASRIRRALPYVDAEHLVIAPDCGLKYTPRPAAFAKLQAMVAGAALVRAELSKVGTGS
jgi:5-methyltetrahydropteroyltriglutamate--homocysteine methyltransferase